MTVIFGSAGHAKEIGFFLKSMSIVPDYFVTKAVHATRVHDVPVITEDDFFLMASSRKDLTEIYVAVGDCTLRKSIVSKIRSSGINTRFPNLIHKSVFMDLTPDAIQLGEGNILFPASLFTTNIKIGNHNHFNLKTSISHDCVIGDYNTISPGVSIAGSVKLGNENFIGTNATVIDGITIGDNLIIGAGATVVRDITEKGTYIGSPAKRKK
jgi:sugar O-acyltransferase (sialic acid O-acetyltransferase NeuD family)